MCWEKSLFWKLVLALSADSAIIFWIYGGFLIVPCRLFKQMTWFKRLFIAKTRWYTPKTCIVWDIIELTTSLRRISQRVGLFVGTNRKIIRNYIRKRSKLTIGLLLPDYNQRVVYCNSTCCEHQFNNSNLIGYIILQTMRLWK